MHTRDDVTLASACVHVDARETTMTRDDLHDMLCARTNRSMRFAALNLNEYDWLLKRAGQFQKSVLRSTRTLFRRR
jgi:hypothetical protein